jgi:hypothetical protein
MFYGLNRHKQGVEKNSYRDFIVVDFVIAKCAILAYRLIATFTRIQHFAAILTEGSLATAARRADISTILTKIASAYDAMLNSIACLAKGVFAVTTLL